MKIVSDPECPLCGGVSSRDDAFFPEHTDGLPVDPVRRLLHPAGLHWGCYIPWTGRPEFARRLFARLVSEAAGLWGCAHVDEWVAVLVSVTEPHALQLILAETGRRLLIAPADWERWRLAPESVAPHCHPVEREALRQALVPVWVRFPDVAALVVGTDWAGSERYLYE